ncbi:MAG: HNH endonuclease [Myxococcota bacterium]
MLHAADLDMQVRLAAFEHLRELVRVHGDVLPAGVLRKGFVFQGQQVRLKGVQGIFKPAVLPELPLSITTAPVEPGRDAPYDDGFSQDGSLLLYRYRGTDPMHHQNVGLRRAMEERRPLIYFAGILRAEYLATWPVYIVADEPAALRFSVSFDDVQFMSEDLPIVSEAAIEARREYITVTTRRRLHQRSFRARVLRAYQERCALCRLRHEQLLDAAHIVPDTDPLGAPVVQNGLALCKLHHAAFDQNFIGIRPDLVVQVRQDILDEEDGPMLTHGLQGFHERPIFVPRRDADRPGMAFLEERYRVFREASG